MTVYAFKNDVTPFAYNIMNTLLSSHDFAILYEGSAIDSKSGAGVTENNVFDYSFAIRFTAIGVTTMARAELTIAADGEGQDLTVEIRGSDFNPDGSAEGTILKTITIPKEFLPATAATWYIPLDLTGLTLGNNYWLVVKKVGDSTNHFHLVGEASQDAAHPCYRRAGTSGVWTANNAIHFAVYDGDIGDPIHCLVPEAVITTVYDGDDPSKIYFYVPPPDGPDGGIREIMDITMSGDVPKRGAVT